MKRLLTIDTEKDFNKNSYENIKKLHGFVKTLEKSSIKISFFVTCDCLQKFPSLFRKLAKKHEIALHGYLHERWDVLGRKEKEERLDKAIKIYKKIFKKSPKGFRAPQFSADFELLELLEKKGFEYDSSIVQFPLSQAIFFPSRFHLYLRQCNFQEQIKKKKMKIREIPVSSFILPISMFSLRILPQFIFNSFAKLSVLFRKDKTLLFLIHSYEFNNANFKRLNKFFKILK